MDFKTNLRFMIVLLLCLFLQSRFSLGADTISANQSLSGDQTLVSAGEKFVLGFFKAGNSSRYYIGMWYDYKVVSERTIVWVANREISVSDRFSSELRISDGNLVLFNESKVPIWSTNVSPTSPSVQAVLQDDGNLVLNDGSNSLQPLWQSFDHPAHTWLPGAKIGFNKNTNTHTLLTSWKNSENPAPGLFSLQLNSNDSSYIILWNRSKQYWTSGSWDGERFSKVPEMRLNYIYNFSYVSNANESYFTYSVYTSANTISRFIMDVSGQIQQQSWLPTNGWNLFWAQPRQQCEIYALCGTYGSCNENSLPFCTCLKGFQPKSQSDWDLKDYSGGCTRNTDLQCGNSSLVNAEKDKFLEMPSMSLPAEKQSVQAGSKAECESYCLNNCSCTGYAYDDSGCSIWIKDILDLQQLTAGDSSGKTFYVRLAASEFQSSKKSKGLIIGVVVGSTVGLAVFLSLIGFLFVRRKKTVRTRVEGSLVAFAYRDLQTATKNFTEKLGGGGFGSVFKGTLPDATVIAVKKLENVGQGEKQFRTEVSTIGTIQHVNLVRLRGFCSEGANRMLVYDYMQNGSLDSLLFHEKESNVLDWKIRYQIALGTARGLVYLHEKCRDCIIHCDIKPENILLDTELCPKVADFGLAKLVGREFSRVLTTMRGTRGYLAPEWIAGVAITAKADVYSYGMMLFEIVSGRRNSEQSEDGKVKFFPSWAASVIAEGGDVSSLLDPKLKGNTDIEELDRVCRVACWCVQDDEANRPSMSQVVQILERVIDVNLPPVPRTLQVFVDSQENVVFFTESSSSSKTSQARSNTSNASSHTKSSSSSTSFKS
ncbi:hypothetical protein UlMin_014313 [Ulmus minor]